MIAHAPGIVHCKCKFCSTSEFKQVDQDELEYYLNRTGNVGDFFPSLEPLEFIYLSHNICPKCYVKKYLNMGDRNTENSLTV